MDSFVALTVVVGINACSVVISEVDAFPASITARKAFTSLLTYSIMHKYTPQPSSCLLAQRQWISGLSLALTELSYSHVFEDNSECRWLVSEGGLACGPSASCPLKIRSCTFQPFPKEGHTLFGSYTEVLGMTSRRRGEGKGAWHGWMGSLCCWTRLLTSTWLHTCLVGGGM